MSSVRARSSDTLLGAANVRSKPCTEPVVYTRPLAPLGAIPSSSQRDATVVSANPPCNVAASSPVSSPTAAVSTATIQVGIRVSRSE